MIENQNSLAYGTARPVSETRRFKPESEKEQKRTVGAGEKDLSLKYVDPQAILGLFFSLHPAECFGHILVCHAGKVCISYDTKTSHYFPLPLSLLSRCLLPSYSSPPRNARGHVTTIMSIFLLSLSFSTSFLLIFLRNLLPSFLLFTLHTIVGIFSTTNYTYPR